VKNPLNYPYFVFLFTFISLWIMAQIGARWLTGVRLIEPDERDNFGVILGATLTLLGLIIGFSFSMAIERYDQRKNLEEEEANAIGTEYVRANLLGDVNAQTLHGQLKRYVDLRILFYQSRDATEITQINSETARLQNDMWAAVERAALAQPTPVSALAVSGMNDVLNSQGYTQAAWWNRIPFAAWALMVMIAICCNVLLGFGTRRTNKKVPNTLLVVMPLVLGISFLLLADIDSPRSGLIRVTPRNMLSLSQSLNNSQ